MSKSPKEYMTDQQNQLANDLATTFNLPVFGDEATKEELASETDYFLTVYGDIYVKNKEGRLAQEVYVVYISEDNPNIEFTTLDVITVGSKVKGFTFRRTIKERVKKGETEGYFDRIIINFRRLLKT